MKPKILIVTDTFPPEKVGSYRMYDISRQMSKDGFEVTVVAPFPTFPFGTFKRIWKFIKISNADKVKLINLWAWQPSEDPPIGSRMLYYLTFPINVVFLIFIYHNFDVILISSGTAPTIFFPCLIAKHIFRKKIMVDIRDLFSDAAIDAGFLKKGGIIERCVYIYEKVIYSNAHKIIGVTKKIKYDLVTKYMVDEDKITVIPQPVDTNIFHYLSVPKKRQIIYTGTIGYAQDLENIILAMKEIANYNVIFLIVGAGDLETKLKKMVKDEGLEKYIFFTGQIERNKIPLIISESLIGIVPLKKRKGLDYAIPAKTYTYMACGLPIIAYGSLELKNLINESRAGIFIDNNDPHSIAKEVIYLLNNPKKMEEMKIKGTEYIKKYTLENITKCFESSIYNILQ